MKNKYSILIYWSEEYKHFFANVPEFDILTDGKTRSEALREAEILITEYIEIIDEDGDTLPEPITLENRE